MSPHHVSINRTLSSSKTSYPNPILRKSINSGLALTTSLRQAWHSLCANHHVHFTSTPRVRYYDSNSTSPMITFDSGADGHYLSEAARISACLPILKPSNKQVSVTNVGTIKALHVAAFLFPSCPPLMHKPIHSATFPTPS